MSWITKDELKTRGITRVEFADTDNGADPLRDCRRILRANGIMIAINRGWVYTNIDPEAVTAKLSGIFGVPVVYDPEDARITIQNWRDEVY